MTINQFKALREAIEAIRHLKHINNDGGVVVMDECEINDLNASLTELEEKLKAER